MNSLEPVCPQKSFIGSLSRLRIGIMPEAWTWVHWYDEFYPPELLPLSVDVGFHKETASLQYTESHTTHGIRKSEAAIMFDSLLSRAEVSAFLAQFRGKKLFAIAVPADGTPASLLMPLRLDLSAPSGKTYDELPANTLRLSQRGLVKSYFLENVRGLYPTMPEYPGGPVNPENPDNPNPQPKPGAFSKGFSKGFS